MKSMERYMRLNNIKILELQYLPKELIDNFAKTYSKSFPELKLREFELITFLKRKFQITENSNFYNIAALITPNGIIASGYGIVRNKYSRGNQKIGVGLVCDVFTNTSFRKMGMFKKVSLLAIEREELTTTNFLIGFPIRDEVMPGHLSVGWNYIFDMPLWWSFPRIGSVGKIVKNPSLNTSQFRPQDKVISISVDDEFLKWRFSLFDVNYYLVSVLDSSDFAIVRKSRIRNLPFTCIIFMQSENRRNTKILVRKIRNLSFRLGTLGVIGSWNNSYAKDLFLDTSGLRKSSKFQKVIVRDLNEFQCPTEENQYRLSWMDSDTL